MHWNYGHWCVNTFPSAWIQAALKRPSVAVEIERKTEVKRFFLKRSHCKSPPCCFRVFCFVSTFYQRGGNLSVCLACLNNDIWVPLCASGIKSGQWDGLVAVINIWSVCGSWCLTVFSDSQETLRDPRRHRPGVFIEVPTLSSLWRLTAVEWRLNEWISIQYFCRAVMVVSGPERRWSLQPRAGVLSYYWIRRVRKLHREREDGGDVIWQKRWFSHLVTHHIL